MLTAADLDDMIQGSDARSDEILDAYMKAHDKPYADAAMISSLNALSERQRRILNKLTGGAVDRVLARGGDNAKR